MIKFQLHHSKLRTFNSQHLIDPVAFSIGPLSVRWYGLAYAIALLLSLFIIVKLNEKRPTFKNREQIFDFGFWIFLLGVLLGGRLGYVLFYNLPFYLENPGKILAVWEGGMSFHGGMLAAIATGYVLAGKLKLDRLKVFDLIVVPAGLATGIGRLANFVNGELYGRVVGSPKWEWLGVDFGDGLLRYPSQLFQAAGEMSVFLILLYIFSRNPKKGVLGFSYLALYGGIRMILELWREPDTQIGFLWGGLTMGQILSALMLIVGFIGLMRMRR